MLFNYEKRSVSPFRMSKKEQAMKKLKKVSKRCKEQNHEQRSIIQKDDDLNELFQAVSPILPRKISSTSWEDPNVSNTGTDLSLDLENACEDLKIIAQLPAKNMVN